MTVYCRSPGLFELLDLLSEHALVVFLSEYLGFVSTHSTSKEHASYPCSLKCTWLTQFWIGTGLQQELDDLGFILEHHSCQYGLASIIQSVGVCAMLNK